MKKLRAMVVVALWCLSAHAAVLFQQAPNPGGGLIPCSFLAPDGMDGDFWVYDSFVLPGSHAITEIDWRGGDTLNGLWGPQPVVDFQISIYPTSSYAGVNEPDAVAPALVQYLAGGDAGATYAGVFGGTAMYDYKFVLPAPFQAVGGVKYWIQIEAFQHVYPNGWGIATGTPAPSGSDGTHFQVITGGTAGGGNRRMSNVPGDVAFTLITSDAMTYTISASASPSGAGSVTGAGAYPAGSTVSLQATANAGFGFSNWTENGVQVSTFVPYSFPAAGDRALVANFVPAYTVTTSASPGYGGATAGDGVYNSGSSATVTALANPGFNFTGWTLYGAPVSQAPAYTFSVSADAPLVANFALNTRSVTYDFDTGDPLLYAQQASTPFSQTSRGLKADFSSPTPGAGGFSVQSDATTHWRLPLFYGNYLDPGSVYNPALEIHFSRPLTMISFNYATADFNQTETPTTIRVTGYSGSTSTTPVGSASNHGAYIGGTMPMGWLAFASAKPFDVALIEIPPATGAASDLLVDNVTVTAVDLPYTVPDIVAALRIAAGFNNATVEDIVRYDIDYDATGRVADLEDAVHVARKVAGLDPNP
ncbi:MAG TPA: hypothetical protein VGM51_18890 [Armatimonadota bacterium]|jgi:hypothetical protein